MRVVNTSILYFFRYADKEHTTPDSPTEERSDPPQFAETCMRELIGRASFGHIRCVIRPVLRYYVNILFGKLIDKYTDTFVCKILRRRFFYLQTLGQSSVVGA